MSNHLHLAIKLCPEQAEELSNEQVVERWDSLFKGPLLLQKWRDGEMLQPAELQVVGDIIDVYRKRLESLSWFMKCLNEPIARQANNEDGCTGHFYRTRPCVLPRGPSFGRSKTFPMFLWEGRYKSQALLTEEALLSCMAYVDLNPVRAGMAPTPEVSDYTSIKERIAPRFDLAGAVREQVGLQALLQFDLPVKPLTQFEGSVTKEEQAGILFSLEDYLELVDYTGRCIRSDKRGSIPDHLPPILHRLTLDHDTWLANATRFEKDYNVKFASRCRRYQKSA